jgi:large subunit ribosomal protein L21
MVYAIISDGSHQYRVEEGQVLEVERKNLPEETKTVEFDRVVLVGDIEDGPRIGQPTVCDAKVTASVLGEVKGRKLIIQKYRKRKNSRVKKGHRQKYLRVKVEKITVTTATDGGRDIPPASDED